jgi:hypothetical protein
LFADLKRLFDEPALESILANAEAKGETVVRTISLIAFTGDKRQTNALGRCLSFEASYTMPSLWSVITTPTANDKGIAYRRDQWATWLSGQVMKCAESLGVNFVGDADDMVDGLIEDFGGLSITDFVLFFCKVKQGAYKTEYEHINVRGLNRDYINNWLKEFVVEVNAAVDALQRDKKEHQLDELRKISIQGPSLVNFRANEKKVEYLRDEWESSLKERKETLYTTYDAFGNPNGEYPMVTRETTSAGWRTLLRNACTWYLPCEPKAFERLEAELKALAIPPTIDGGDAYNYQVKTTLLKWSREANATGIRLILISDFCQRNKITTGRQLLEAFNATPRDWDFMEAVKGLDRKIGDVTFKNWIDYCQQNKESTGFVFTKNEFFYRATVIFLSECEKKITR